MTGTLDNDLKKAFERAFEATTDRAEDAFQDGYNVYKDCLGSALDTKELANAVSGNHNRIALGTLTYEIPEE